MNIHNNNGKLKKQKKLDTYIFLVCKHNHYLHNINIIHKTQVHYYTEMEMVINIFVNTF